MTRWCVAIASPFRYIAGDLGANQSPAMRSTWQPTEITGFVDHFDTACSVLLVDTDAGRGYLKAMGNLAGNHALACEWLGTSFAQMLGLPTFHMALVEVRADDVLHFARGGRA